MESDTVLWWALLLVVFAGAFTYRTEVLDVFWNKPADADNSLFETNPAVYAGHVLSSGLSGVVKGIF
jgi:hypothetical protein